MSAIGKSKSRLMYSAFDVPSKLPTFTLCGACLEETCIMHINCFYWNDAIAFVKVGNMEQSCSFSRQFVIQ